MENRIGFIGAVLSVVFLLVAWSCSDEREDRTDDRAEEVAAADPAEPQGALPRGLVLRSVDGRKIPISDYAGELVLVNFWATWNNKSRELLTVMNKLHPRYSKRYHFLNVSMDEGGVRVVRTFAQTHSVAGEVIVNGREVADAFGGIGTIPATLLILRDGSVARRLKGLHRREKYEKLMTFFGMSTARDR
jgi:thiol-disulfide isomerase/thioredoxin